MNRSLAFPLLAFARARNLNFAIQYAALTSISALLPGSTKPYRPSLEVIRAIQADLHRFIKADVQNIMEEIYPASVLKPESPIRHIKRVSRIVADAVSIYRRKRQGKTKEFDKNAAELLDELPDYYRRNFHFQTDGYLSEHSADLYEHQVELLFAGTADAMRRLIIVPLKEKFGKSYGTGLRFLEVGAGTGRATRFVHLAFPKAKITATDLSEPYLKGAQKKLMDLRRIDFIQADGAKLPFQDRHFDAVYSVFMFHELPLEIRKQVIDETKRVTKPGGFWGGVDSVQLGDFATFDPLLDSFARDFHEPFYKNYITHPMTKLLQTHDLKAVDERRGFFSKVFWASV